MTAADQALIAQLPGLAFAFALVLARCAGAVALMPGFAEAGVPPMVRAGIAGCLALLLTPVIAPMVPLAPIGPAGFAADLAAELLVGLWLGFLARLLVLALPLAGQLLAGLLGQQNVIQPDPLLGPQTSALSQAFGVAAAALVLASGLYALPVAALAGSYRVIGPGVFLTAGGGAEQVAGAVEQSFGFAVRLAAPGILLSVLWNLGLGAAARIAPRIQIYFLAMPAQILMGLVLLVTLATPLLLFWQETVRSGFDALPGLN